MGEKSQGLGREFEGRDPEVETSWTEAMRTGKPFRDDHGTLVYPTAKSRPQPAVRMDPFHRGLLASSVAVAVLVSVYTLLQIPSMSEEVPVRWGFSGDVTYGSPATMIWPVLGLLVGTLGCAVLARYPRIYNYPRELNERNVQRQYRNGAQLMVWTTASLAMTTLGMALPAITGAETAALTLVGVGMLMLSSGYFIWKMLTLK
ncbi:DUF1648 domain-containing protein [Nesterenkonia lacusekhoensis]|uniref:DUF1648 domain-containing protein n=1 Tax=Nesterenkonia lacusekhoensis TaxID=150832 RepID=A0ABS4T311_9MICC|nr:hypothetical protein [Nesterenkonia lacusekhoensis]MBP2318847.1 hypothetical protein [Nesterenkonia lacusekhoensis]